MNGHRGMVGPKKQFIIDKNSKWAYMYYAPFLYNINLQWHLYSMWQ